MIAVTAIVATLAFAAPAQEASGPLDALFPPGRLARVTVPDGSVLLDSRLAATLTDLLAGQGDVEGLQRLAGAVRLATGAEPEAVLRQLVGGGFDVAVYAGRGRGAAARTRRVLAASRSTDADALRRMLDAFVALADSGGRTTVARKRHAGRSLVTLDERVTLCAAGDLLLIATDDRLVRNALDALDALDATAVTDSTGSTDTDRAAGDAAAAAASVDSSAVGASGAAGDAPLLGFAFDTGVLRARDARSLAPPAGTPARRYANPVANLLFAGVGASDGLVTGTLREESGRLMLTVCLPAALSSAPAAYAPPADAPVEVPVDAETAAVLFARRDLADWWRHRESLMDEELQPRLAKFDQTLGLLFMGGSPAEDVFAGLTPDLALVVDRLDFTESATVPDVRLPGACLVARMRDPAAFRTGMQVAFQTLIGIANTERAKDGNPPFLLETAEHEGESLRCARLVPVEQAGAMSGGLEARDAELALAPTLAFVDDLLLLGTSEEQVRRLVSAWKAGRRLSLRGNTELRIEAPVVARLVRDNRGPLVAKTMLDDGLDPPDAGRRIDGLLAVLDRVGLLSLMIEDEARGACVQLQVDPPDGTR